MKEGVSMKTKGILFIISTEQLKPNLQHVANEVAEQLSVPFKICFFKEENGLEEDVLELIAKGCHEIIFLPVSLFSSTEIRETLPKRISAILAQRTTVTPTFLKPLGSTHAILHFLAAQLAQQANLLPQAVLLIAQANLNDAAIYDELKDLAQKLTIISGRKVYFASVSGDFYYHSVIAQLKFPLLVQPLLIDTTLARKITSEIGTLRGQQDTILPSLGESQVLKKALWERLKEVGGIKSSP